MGENQSAKHKEMTEKIREQKQAPKGPIKFQIQLNEEQKIAKEKILSNAVTVLSGKAGSGKTLLACQVALDLLFKKSIQSIIDQTYQDWELKIVIYNMSVTSTIGFKFKLVADGVILDLFKEHLKETLDSWEKVRGLDDYDFYFKIEPSEHTQGILDVIGNFDSHRNSVSTILLNKTVLRLSKKSSTGLISKPFNKSAFIHAADFITK